MGSPLLWKALLLGAVAQSSLILSGLAVYLVQVPKRVIGGLAGFGGGALVSAVAFDLIPDSDVLARVEVALWLLFGAAVFVVSDRLVEVRFGDDEAQGGSPLGIVVGAIIDGVPESLVFGIQMAAGLAISPAFLGAVFISNVPQALAPSADLAQAGWSARKVTWMWGSVVLACGVAAGLGFLLSDAAGAQGGRAAGLAAGGVLAMLTNSLMPYAFDRAGAWAGIWTVVGFAASMAYT